MTAVAEITVTGVDTMADGLWRWDTSGLTWRPTRHGHLSTLDPFPAYPHDLAVVRDTADRVAAVCPPRWDVAVYVLDRESVERTNGHSELHAEGHYNEADEWVKDPMVGLIVLSGKRIPPHPAMTRYLVAHEYGHNMQWMIAEARGAKHPNDDVILVEYARMRGLPEPIHAGTGGRWHDAAAEVFACDFRVLVCGVETEFWPHPGVPRPGEQVAAWWAEAVADMTAPAVLPVDASG